MMRDHTYDLFAIDKSTETKLIHLIKENNTFAPHPFSRINLRFKKSSSSTQIKVSSFDLKKGDNVTT